MENRVKRTRSPDKQIKPNFWKMPNLWEKL